MTDILQIKSLTKRYTTFELENISFTLPSGCIMGLIGENGAGKTTLIKLILDLVEKDHGSVTLLDHQKVVGNERIKEYVGVVMEELQFIDTFTAKQIDGLMKHCYRTWDSDRYRQYLNTFRLPPTKKLKEYSRGMKMKLSIAVALSHDSKLLILDEATSGLDPVVRDEILDIFLQFIQDESHSILLSSHILSDLEKVCDYITFLHQGKLLFCEDKDVLLDTYAVVKGSTEQMRALDRNTLIGLQSNAFGAQALMKRRDIPAGMTVQHTTIEDIMLHFVKGGSAC